MKAVWERLCGGVSIAKSLRKNWRTVLKELLVIALKAFVLFQMAFMLAMTLTRVVQPEQPEYAVKPIFRVVGQSLAGYVVRKELYDNVCNQTDEFILGSKFLRKEVCQLKNQPFPSPKNRHFNLQVSQVDPRCSRVEVCWLKRNLTREVCQELFVREGIALAHSIDILEVDFVEVSMDLPNEAAVLQEPVVTLVLDEGSFSLNFRRWYGVLALVYSSIWGLLAAGIISVIEIGRLWRQLPTLTKHT